jgi:cobalamin 5'-phosphate synthase/cobalamin synthase
MSGDVRATARDLRAALAFLTRLPVAGPDALGPAEVGRAAAWFPAVGLLVGAVHVGASVLFDPVFPPHLVAGIVIAVDTLLTGALHLDGLADSADGFGGGWSKTRVLEIMRDHAVGTYGSLALILVVGLRWAGIAELLEAPPRFGALLIAPVAGRWAGVTLGYALPYARDSSGSTGAACAHIGGREWVIATAVSAAAATFALGAQAFVLAIAVTATIVVWGEYCYRRIRGVTGDTVGTVIAVSEVVFLLTAVALGG